MTHAAATKAESKSAPAEAKRAEPRAEPAGTPTGVPIFLQTERSAGGPRAVGGAAADGPPVQAKCACGGACAACAQRDDVVVQHKCACGGTCSACASRDETLQKKERAGHHHDTSPHTTIHETARAGVETAHEPLPHVDRIQASFGTHDIRGVRAQVGGAATGANAHMGSLGYTVGDRIGFRSSPDVKLAAHEATHVIQQQRGVQLSDGVGHPDDEYERQADEVAAAVERGESAEPILDRGAASGGLTARDEELSVQHQLTINATRLFEPGVVSSQAGVEESGGGGEPAASEGGGGSAAEESAGGGEDAGASDADAAAEGGEGGGGARGGGEGSGGGDAGGGGGGAAAPPGGGSQTTSTASAAPCSGSAQATCYREPTEEPDPEPEEQPENPQGTEVEQQTSDEGEEDAPEPDNCPAPAEATAQSGAAGGSAAGGGPAVATSTPAVAASSSPAAATAAPAGGGGGGGRSGGGGADATGSAAAVSPFDAAIVDAEGGRAQAVAAYEGSSAALAAASDQSAALRGGTHFAQTGGGSAAEVAARSAAAARADLFFTQAADQLDAAIDFALHTAPDQLGAQAEAAKAEIAASIETQKSAISERIDQARGAARVAAALARQEVMLQAESFVADVEAQTSAAIDALAATHDDTMSQVDDLETTTLDSINEIYAQGRTDLAGLGPTVGAECLATGETFATTYAGFRHCTENGFWDGDLSERRSMAQEKAARSTAQGFNDRMIESARKRAREITRAGRKNDRCAVIAAAANSRDTLDQTLTALTQALESTRDSTIEQAGSARDSIISSINGSLASTLRQLDQQEHSQRQAANDTGYTQQVTQETIAFAASASLQQGVAAAATAVQSTLGDAQTRLAASAPPDPAVLDQALSQITQRLSSALSSLQSTVDGGASLSAEQLSNAAAQGLAALEGVTQGNDQMAGAVSDGFASSMGQIAGRDNFAEQRAGFTQVVEQSSQAGTAALAQALDGMTTACDERTNQAEETLDQAYVDLEQNLRQSQQGLECDIVQKADEAASHEAPAWKMLVAILLVIIVIVIVIAVTILTAGGALAGLGVVATIAAGAAIGAVVGAVTSGLLAIASNLWNNRSWTRGVGEAILIGAITGAIGGGIGAAAGAGVGAIFQASSKAVQVGAQFVTAMVTAGGMDVVTQYVMGGMSWDHFSKGQLGLTLLITALTFGLGHYAGARAQAPRAGAGPTPEPGVPGPHPTEPIAGAHPTEPIPAAHPTEPVPAAHPTEPTPTAAHPSEPAAPAAHAGEAPAGAHPEELPTTGARPEEHAAPAAAGETETPVAPAERAAPEPAAPRTSEEASLLEGTSSKSSEELTPTEVTTEREIANRGEGTPIDEPPFTVKHDLPNGHEIKETPNGEFFERCSGHCVVFDSEGNPRRMGSVSAGPPGPEFGPEGFIEHPTSTPEVSQGPTGRSGTPEPIPEPEPLAPVPEPEPTPRFEDLPEHLEETGAPTHKQEQAGARGAADETSSRRPDVRTSESTSGPERARAAAERAERTPAPTPDDSDVVTVPDEPPPGELFDPEAPPPMTPERARLEYMGRTPSKYSDVGAEVVARMRANGQIRGNGPLLEGNPNGLEVLGPDGQWHLIDRNIDMAHNSPNDAVRWWNAEGRFYGARSPEVIEFMNNPDNYTLMPMGPNRSAGAQIGETYLPPER